MNEIARIEPTRAPLMAGGRPAAIVPQSMEDTYRLATAVVKAGMAPRGLDTPEKAMVAMLHGLEVGLTPMAALQRIAVVNGRPTIWGDGAMGLVRGSGLCEWVRETITGEGDAMVATCEAKRRNDPEPVKRTFSVADAKKAKLWNKQGPWQEFPTRMLAMRARAFCLRDGFADVLGGLYLKEEIDNGDEAPARRAPQPVPANIENAPQAPLEQLPAPRRAPPPTTELAGRPSSPIDAFRVRAAAASNTEELGRAWDEIVEPIYDRLLEDEQQECLLINRTRAAEVGTDDDGGEANEP